MPAFAESLSCVGIVIEPTWLTGRERISFSNRVTCILQPHIPHMTVKIADVYGHSIAQSLVLFSPVSTSTLIEDDLLPWAMEVL